MDWLIALTHHGPEATAYGVHGATAILMFAATLAKQVELGRAVTGAERARIVRSESRFLLLAVPPVMVVGILTLVGLSVSASIRCLVVLGAVSLGCWGGVAGRRSGMTGWRLVLAVAAGLVIGALVLGLDVFLQPGKAFAAAVA